MGNSLFLESTQTKEAGARMSLGDNPQAWAEELLSALLDRAPFLGNYQVDPHILGQDDRSGYAYGFFMVAPRPAPQVMASSIQPAAPPQQQGQHLRVPFVVARRKMKPLNIFIDPVSQKALPLSQRRVEPLLFSPTTFGVSSIDQQMSAPVMSGTPVMSQDVQNQVKVASVCTQVGSLISVPAKEKLAEALTSDPEFRHAIQKNPAFNKAATELLSAPTKTAAELQEEIKNQLPVDALLVEKTASGFRVTTGCTHAFAPTSTDYELERQLAVPDYLRKEATEHGYALRARSLPLYSAPTQVAAVADAGVYQVQTKTAAEMKPALVFTEVQDLDGNTVSGSLVKTASGHSYQERAVGIAATTMSEGLAPPAWSDYPRGEGFFITKTGAATTPVTLDFYENHPSGVYAHFTAATTKGKMKIASPDEEDFGILKLSAGSYAIHPKTLARFCRLGPRESFCDNVGLAEKLATVGGFANQIKVTHAEGEFALEGGPVAALGSDMNFLKEAQAVFFLSLTGIDPILGKAKLAEARVVGKTTVPGFRTIHTYEDQQAFAKTAAEEQTAKFFPMGTDMTLAKAAAAISDAKTVDAVLGLNFITPENVALFVGKLPMLEDALSTMCELYMAAQIGVQELPTSALDRAIKAVDAITAGLELLRLKSKETEAAA